MAKASASTQNDTPGLGHNADGMTADQRKCLALMYRREHRPLDEAKKQAASDLQAWGRRMKADLGKEGKIEVETLIAMETEQGAAKVDAELKAKSRARSWAAPTSDQLGLFSEKDINGETKAYNAGKLSGMDDEPLSNPYGASTSDHEDYGRGYYDGRKIMVDLFAERDRAAEEAKAAELIEGPGHDDADEANPFDQAAE